MKRSRIQVLLIVTGLGSIMLASSDCGRSHLTSSEPDMEMPGGSGAAGS